MKKLLFLTAVLSILTLPGCSRLQGYAEEQISSSFQASKEEEGEEDYKKYKELQAAGELNQNGEYNGLEEVKELQETEEADAAAKSFKQVHITFAENHFLKVSYYYDELFTEPVDTSSCYLDPGERLYASQPKCDNPYSNTYVFSEFRIYEYDEEGNREVEPSFTGGKESQILEIPADYTGTDLSIEPVGEYQSRKISLEEYYRNSNGEKQKVSGLWLINEEEYLGETVEISPSASYFVEYWYDKDEYYFVDSSPKAYAFSEPGKVQFREATALDDITSYSIELHPFISALFSYDSSGEKAIQSIKVNNTDAMLINNKLIKLKSKDVITIETNEEYRIFCSDFSIEKPEEISGGFRYTITVPDTYETTIHLKVSKSQLKVVLDDSVGYETAFGITASGINLKNQYYEKQTLGADFTVVDQSIGAEEEIVISASNDMLPFGYALKLDVSKVDGNGVKSDEIRYLSDLPKEESISVYGNGDTTVFNKIYKQITVKISMVKVIAYEQQTIANATITVSIADSLIPLKTGDILEDSRNVEVTIIPDEGYYVTGKDVTDDIYKDTMKFSKYVSDREKILEKHAVKKIYQVTLDSSDPYGVCKYKLNGTEISGDVNLREEDELILEYELTDNEYQFVRESDGFIEAVKNFGANIFSKKKETVKITISDEINGRTIKRGDYITIKKKGS